MNSNAIHFVCGICTSLECAVMSQMCGHRCGQAESDEAPLKQVQSEILDSLVSLAQYNLFSSCLTCSLHMYTEVMCCYC